jgi:hypothetical protein
MRTEGAFTLNSPRLISVTNEVLLFLISTRRGRRPFANLTLNLPRLNRERHPCTSSTQRRSYISSPLTITLTVTDYLTVPTHYHTSLLAHFLRADFTTESLLNPFILSDLFQ